jgi:tellurite resistance protein
MPNKKQPGTFTNKEHQQHCIDAGCKHDAVHRFGKGKTVQGWCMLCRRVAFGSNP